MTHRDGDAEGLEIAPIPIEEFRGFAKRHGTSPEIGPIATCLDDAAGAHADAEVHVIGLKACDKLCAAACFELFRSRLDPTVRALKLDSVIVDPKLRRRGLAGLLVTRSFLDFVTDPDRNIARIYAHSVHPATVEMLRRLGFNDPPVTGAPISNLDLMENGSAAFVQRAEEQLRTQIDQKRLQCEFCLKRSRRARPWCLPRNG